jgi:hypothetical protein
VIQEVESDLSGLWARLTVQQVEATVSKTTPASAMLWRARTILPYLMF